jgi:aspartokinase-like uncharacterized kinase
VAERSVDGTGRLVVKVGGSLAETGRLAGILSMIAAAKRPVIVVPGGGQFADKVRDLQNVMQLDDKSAHKLAMLGMHQMAEIYFAKEPRLAPADSVDGIARVLASGNIPVWLPFQMCQHDETIPADWTITSDGLAARLAERLGGLPVVLLKSLDIDVSTPLEQLAEEDVVDAAFPGIVRRARLDCRILGPADDAALEQLLGTSSAPAS